MDLKACDRCRKQFRVVGEGRVAPIEPPADPDEKPPKDLEHILRMTLPAAYRMEKGEKKFLLVTLDVCAKCAVDFQPVVGQWLQEAMPAEVIPVVPVPPAPTVEPVSEPS